MLKPARRPNPAHTIPHTTRTLLHFDYDSFYASVIESTSPHLKTLPLAVQQKQIIVTCNYEARRRGLHKLQLITEAKRICPDVIIVLGEDLTRFRDASKKLYAFLRGWSWNERVERLGMDEVWMDVSDVVAWNRECVDWRGLGAAFFQTDRRDPTVGFGFDGRGFAGHVFPGDGAKGVVVGPESDELTQRLMLASHLAMHIRHRMEEELGYTSTAGISTNRLLSKLVGNVNKPRGQTTLLPPHESAPATNLVSNVQIFMDGHDVGAVPWIGFKSAQKLREMVLRRPAEFYDGLVYGGSKEAVTVEMVRKMEGLTPEALEKLLAGPGQPKGIGHKVWGLLHGVDDSEVAEAKNVPRQISIEDSYVRLDTMKQLTDELLLLSARLLERMRVDLTKESDEHEGKAEPSKAGSTVWIGKPHTLRLTTRPRLPVGPNGTRPRTFKRISRTCPMPSFVFSLEDNVDALASRLVNDGLVPLFKKLHPEKSGWNLSLINVAATDMVDAGADSKSAVGRNIQSMFKNQGTVLQDFQVVGEEAGLPPESAPKSLDNYSHVKHEHAHHLDEVENVTPQHENPSTATMLDGMEETVSMFKEDDEEDADDDDTPPGSQEYECPVCEEVLPSFAAKAHERFHTDAG